MGKEFSYIIHISLFSIKLCVNSAGELYRRETLRWGLGRDGVAMEPTVRSMIIISHTSLLSLTFSVWV